MITEYIRYNLPAGLNPQFEADYVKAADYLQASVVGTDQVKRDCYNTLVD